jgi:hypothetical protein
VDEQKLAVTTTALRLPADVDFWQPTDGRAEDSRVDTSELPTAGWRLVRVRLSEADLRRLRLAADTHLLTFGVVLRIGLELVLQRLLSGPLELPALAAPVLAAGQPPRIGPIVLRLTSSEAHRLARASHEHGVTQAALLRYGAKLALAELERDPRPIGGQLGLPPSLCNKIEPLPRGRAARGSGQLVRADGSPSWTPSRGNPIGGKGPGKGSR